MRLEPLYRIRFTYPESWSVTLGGDVVCACAGEVRAPSDPAQQEPDLVLDVAELVWEPIAG